MGVENQYQINGCFDKHSIALIIKYNLYTFKIWKFGNYLPYSRYLKMVPKKIEIKKKIKITNQRQGLVNILTDERKKL